MSHNKMKGIVYSYDNSSGNICFNVFYDFQCFLKVHI